jgi:hypothetical protein
LAKEQKKRKIFYDDLMEKQKNYSRGQLFSEALPEIYRGLLGQSPYKAQRIFDDLVSNAKEIEKYQAIEQAAIYEKQHFHLR